MRGYEVIKHDINLKKGRSLGGALELSKGWPSKKKSNVISKARFIDRVEDSKWISSIMFVLKKSGKRRRACVDYRPLTNAAQEREGDALLELQDEDKVWCEIVLRDGVECEMDGQMSSTCIRQGDGYGQGGGGGGDDGED